MKKECKFIKNTENRRESSERQNIQMLVLITLMFI